MGMARGLEGYEITSQLLGLICLRDAMCDRFLDRVEGRRMILKD